MNLILILQHKLVAGLGKLLTRASLADPMGISATLLAKLDPADIHKADAYHPKTRHSAVRHDTAQPAAAHPTAVHPASVHPIVRPAFSPVLTSTSTRTSGCTSRTNQARAVPLRVVRVLDHSTGRTQAGRLVISGSMADVCAELDRLAAFEGVTSG